MARVLSDDTYKIILENFQHARQLSRDPDSIEKIDDIINRLSNSPVWRKGQDYSG